jgi:hypothetical protein
MQPRTQCFVRDWVSELLMKCTNLFVFVGRWVCLAQPWREESEEPDGHGAREQPREKSTWLAMNLVQLIAYIVTQKSHCLYLCVYYHESRRNLYLPSEWQPHKCIYMAMGCGHKVIWTQHVVWQT